MLKKHFHKILFCLATLGITSLQAANYDEQKEGYGADAQKTAPPISQPDTGYYDYTLKHSKKKIDNSVVTLLDLQDTEEYFKENKIANKIKGKNGVVFFMVITCNERTKALSKFFFINASPSAEKEAIRRAEGLYHCHVISHKKPILSPHLVFQLLGWLAQEERKYTPVFIHANVPICITCKEIVASLFHFTMPSNAKGCKGLHSIDFEKICPLVQQYINSCLTLEIAKKILLPKDNEHLKQKQESKEFEHLLLQQLAAVNKENLALEKNLLAMQKKFIAIGKIIQKETSYFGYSNANKVNEIIQVYRAFAQSCQVAKDNPKLEKNKRLDELLQKREKEIKKNIAIGKKQIAENNKEIQKNEAEMEKIKKNQLASKKTDNDETDNDVFDVD